MGGLVFGVWVEDFASQIRSESVIRTIFVIWFDHCHMLIMKMDVRIWVLWCHILHVHDRIILRRWIYLVCILKLASIVNKVDWGLRSIFASAILLSPVLAIKPIIPPQPPVRKHLEIDIRGMCAVLNEEIDSDQWNHHSFVATTKIHHGFYLFQINLILYL